MRIARLKEIINVIFQSLESGRPAWWLLLRVWIATVFFKSGLVKIEDFETTIFLFAEEYKVPLLSPMIAATFATFFELICPILLVFGLATRLAAIPLLIMTAVIQFTYMDHVQHYYWALISLGLIINGGGNWSADRWIAQRHHS